jgi:hypothetical protein
LLGDVGDGGTCVKEAASAGLQELIIDHDTYLLE